MKYEPYESFKHGLTISKIWLCENLEPHVPNNAVVYVLGCWTNVLAYMMLVRNSKLYSTIFGYDSDPDAIEVANKICDAWHFEDIKVYHEIADANQVVFKDCDVVINHSVEHMEDHTWFNNIPDGTLVCIQSSNATIKESPWFITNPITSESDLINKYHLREILYIGTKDITYGNWGYKRFMLIGRK